MEKLLKACPDDLVTITNNDCRITIKVGNSQFDLSHKATDALEFIGCFPEIGELTAEAGIPVQYIKDFAKAWGTFASRDELRPVMNYISLDLTDGAGYLVATNAHILFRVKFEWHTDQPHTILIPSRDISKLCKMMPKKDIHIRKYDNWSEVEVGEIRMLYYNLGDKYPNWRAVVPASGDKIAFDAKELKTSIKQIHIFTNPSTHQIILESNDDGTYFHAHDLDDDNHATVQVKADRQWEPIKIGFNSSLLLQCLDVIKGATMTMEYTAANRAVTFAGDASSEVLVLLMPVMLND